MTLTFPLRVKAGQLHSHKMQFASNDFTDLESCRKRQCGSKRIAQEYQKKSQLRVNPYIMKMRTSVLTSMPLHLPRLFFPGLLCIFWHQNGIKFKSTHGQGE